MWVEEWEPGSGARKLWVAVWAQTSGKGLEAGSGLLYPKLGLLWVEDWEQGSGPPSGCMCGKEEFHLESRTPVNKSTVRGKREGTNLQHGVPREFAVVISQSLVTWVERAATSEGMSSQS